MIVSQSWIHIAVFEPQSNVRHIVHWRGTAPSIATSSWKADKERAPAQQHSAWTARLAADQCHTVFPADAWLQWSLHPQPWVCTRYCRSVMELAAGTGCGGRWSEECCSKGFCWWCRADWVRKSIPVDNCSGKEGVFVSIGVGRKWDECISSTLLGVSRAHGDDQSGLKLIHGYSWRARVKWAFLLRWSSGSQ